MRAESAPALADESGLPAIGERLTYTIGFDRFRDAGFAEIETVSRGKMAGRDAIEMRSRFRTYELVSAAFFLIDESRTVFVSPENGLPLLVKVTERTGVVPVERAYNYVESSSPEFDLLSLVQRIRMTGGSGTFALNENGRKSTVTAVPTVGESVKTDAGEFDTTVVAVSGDYFAEKGIGDLRINLTGDARRIPVLVRGRIGKSELRITLASIQTAAEPVGSPTPAASPAASPAPTGTPAKRPKPTPLPYLDNQPLGSDIPFALGETTEYRVTSDGRPIGLLELKAVERKETTSGSVAVDSLLLAAVVKNAEPGFAPFKSGDAFRSWVDPVSLAPIRSEASINGGLSVLNENVLFDQARGAAFPQGAEQIQIPVNTHSLLSLIYAVRSFNLRPSKDATNPVNDTRVAVLVGGQFYVFMLRPSTSQIITLKGEKVPAQMVTVFTGNPQFDALNIRVWLSNDPRRTPVRFAVGPYQADLETRTERNP
jgi:hypothetical protein